MIGVGLLLVLGAGGLATLAASGGADVGDPMTFVWLSGLGALLFVAGLVYVAVRQLRVRRVLPPERYRGPSVALLLVLAIVLAVGVTLPFGADVEALLAGEELSRLGAIVLLASTQVALLLVGWAFVLRTNALAGLPAVGSRADARTVLTGIGWGLAAWIGANIVAVVVAYLFELVGIEATPQAAEQAAFALDPVLVVASFVILAPIAEEIFFRGIVYNAWLREGGRRYAYIGSSLLFAISHLSLVQFIPLLLLGLALAWVYERTGSLVAAIAMHATFNAVTVVLLFLVRFDVVQLPT